MLNAKSDSEPVRSRLVSGGDAFRVALRAMGEIRVRVQWAAPIFLEREEGEKVHGGRDASRAFSGGRGTLAKA